MTRLEPLFATNKEREAFKERHARVDFPRKRLFDCKGPLYLGIDAGSTTVKMAVIDDAGNLVYSCYTPVQGDALATATDELLDLFEKINDSGQTILMVTHSVKAASHAKRVLFIKDGEVFHQLYRGEMSREAMYGKIADTLTVLQSGVEGHE